MRPPRAAIDWPERSLRPHTWPDLGPARLFVSLEGRENNHWPAGALVASLFWARSSAAGRATPLRFERAPRLARWPRGGSGAQTGGRRAHLSRRAVRGGRRDRAVLRARSLAERAGPAAKLPIKRNWAPSRPAPSCPGRRDRQFARPAGVLCCGQASRVSRLASDVSHLASGVSLATSVERLLV